MNVAAVRNNLRIAGSDVAVEPGGHAWTVRIIRPTDPRARWVVYSNWYLVARLLFCTRRAITRDRRWLVEALPVSQSDWARAVRIAVVHGKATAVERGIAALQEVAAGHPPTEVAGA